MINPDGYVSPQWIRGRLVRELQNASSVEHVASAPGHPNAGVMRLCTLLVCLAACARGSGLGAGNATSPQRDAGPADTQASSRQRSSLAKTNAW